MKRVTFRMKVMVALIAVGIIQGAIMGFFAYNHARTLIFGNKKSEMVNMVDKIDISVSDKIGYLTQLAQSTATSQIVRDNIHVGADILQIGQSKRNISQYFSALALSFEPLCNIMIIDRSNILYSPYDYYRAYDFDMPSSTYYVIASEHIGSPVWLGMQENLMCAFEGISGPDWVLTMVGAITDFYNEEVIAILIMDLDPETFRAVLSNESISFPNQTTFLLDQNQNLICGDSQTSDDMVEGVCSYLNGMEDGCTEITIGGDSVLLSLKTNEQTGWKICSMVPVGDISAQVQSLNYSIIKTVVACTAGAAIFIFLTSYALTIPVKKLIFAMKEVQRGNFNCRIKNRRKDEMGCLIDTFNFMVNKIQTLIKEVYEERLSQKNAELKALQSQINPHFLYNTLDTINWMLLERREYEISNIVISLGSMMKYAINPRSKLATVEQEMEHISNYLLIQKERMEDKLNYEIHIPDGLKKLVMPRLFLQPIVENAVVHGIEPMQYGGTVIVEGAEETDSYVLSVSDNGAGMSRERLETLFVGKEEQSENHLNIGIKNVKQRMELFYGERSQLVIESNMGKGTRVFLMIPKEGEKGHESRSCG